MYVHPLLLELHIGRLNDFASQLNEFFFFFIPYHQPSCRDSIILPTCCRDSRSAIVWGNLPPRNTLIMRASKRNSRTRPQNLLQASSRTERPVNSYLKPIKSKSVDKASPISGGRAGGWTAETSSRPESGQGSFVCSCGHSPHSPYSRSPGRCYAGSETGSGEISRGFSDSNQRHDIYNSPWIAVVTLNRNQNGNNFLIWQHVRLIFYAAAISTAAVTATYATHHFYISALGR